MADILFGQSYYLRFDPKLWSAMQPFAPLGTLYAASLARSHGHSVALFDAMLAESEAEWAAALDKERPSIAIIYEDNFNYLSKMCLLNMRQAAFKMLAMAKERGCITIICGADATDHMQSYLAAGADYILRGEGEETLIELLDWLNGRWPNHDLGKPDLHNIRGLAYLPDGATTPHLTPPRPVLKAIDDLPFPAWDLVNIDRYKAIWYEHHGLFALNMVTTRGCPYHCNWCAKPIWGQRYNSRSPQNVVGELKWLKETYQPDYIWFADDIMGLKPNWWQEYADLVEQADVQTPFKCLSRADLIVRQAENVTALKRAGCDIVWIGAESGSQKILNAMEKGTTVEQIYAATQALQVAGVRIAFFLQFGYPGETRADIEKTLQMVRDCLPDDIGMSVSYPLPGTQFFTNVQQQLGNKQNWTDSADLAMMYHGTFSTDFYRQLHSVLHKEFRSRRAWHSLKQVWHKPQQWSWHHLREGVSALYRLLTLPRARAKLNQLAQTTPASLTLGNHMSLEAAAQPSPQE